MSNLNPEATGLTGTKCDFAKGLLGVLQKIIQDASNRTLNSAPVLFPHGVGVIDLTSTVEPQKINFSLKITDDIGKDLGLLATNFETLADARTTAEEILRYCVSADDDVMTGCNAFAKCYYL